MSKPAVRQMRGPGMNKGLKKPRHGQFAQSGAAKTSKPLTDAQGGSRDGSNNYKKARAKSYLSENLDGKPWGNT